MKGLGAIVEEWGNCTKCPLHETRRTIVLGEGPQNADIVIVGEAPGKVEDETGKPFRGASGAVLDEKLEIAGIDRDKIFITNAVACHPPEDRDPEPEEIAACRPRLLETIYIVDPILIIAMGAVAAKALTGKAQKITSKRGEILTISIPGIVDEVQYPVLLTVHPAYLLRSYDTLDGGWVSMFVEDLRMAKKIVDGVLSAA